MPHFATTQEKIPRQNAASFAPIRGGVLQRKCACGGTPGPTGECEECRKKRLALQTKPKFNEPGNTYEQEADRIADQVMTTPADPAVSGAPPAIRRFSGQSNGRMDSVPASVDHVLASPGRPLEPGLREDMEHRFSHDFSRVRVHINPAAARSAFDVDANAYTVSNNIVFGAGQFAPDTIEGRRLLAHELTHVVQQSGSAGMAFQRKPRGAAAGCGICMNDPGGRIAGDIAHAEVQNAFIAANPDMVAERPVPGIPNSGIDISYERRRSGEHGLFIGEIKPLDDAGRQAGIGRRQLQDYWREMMLTGQYDEVYRMPNAPPKGPLYFFNQMNPPRCPRQTIMVQLTEPGLYQYYCEPPFSQLVRTPGCRCQPRRDDEPPGPYVPPIWVRPSDQPGSSETKGKGDQPGKGDGEPGKGDRPGKGNGEPGKGDRGRRPGRTPGRDQPQQPTFRLPRGPIWDKVYGALAVIGGLVALFSLWGKVGALLGLLARALGFTLGLVGGAVAAAAGTPGKAGGPPVVKPTPGGVTTPSGTTGAKERKRSPTARVGARQTTTPTQPIEVKAIEGLNAEKAAVGMVFPVQFHYEGELKQGVQVPDVAILQVTRVLKDKSGTTLELTSLQERMYAGYGNVGKTSLGGKTTYYLTHPYRPSDPEKPGLVGFVIRTGADGEWFWKYLENLANELETAGHKNLANQVRSEVQRLKQQAARQSP